MEIKNKKWMFALILLILTLISAAGVAAQGLLYRLAISNIGMYLGGKMIANYMVVFALLFVIVYFVAFNEKTRPGGVLMGFFLAALFILSIFITVLITRGAIAKTGQGVFIWELSKLAGAGWLFKLKTIVNIIVVAGICFIVKTYLLKEYGKEKEGKVATWFVIILISIFAASIINYSATAPKDPLPAGVTYIAEDKYIDRWIWQFPQVSKIKLFLFGDQPDGSYKSEGETKQGILTFGDLGKGIPAFFIGSLLLIWLFIHFDIFSKAGKGWQYSVPIFLAALLANQGYTQENIMGYAWWAALIVINSSLKKSMGQDRPGIAFGLAFAIVQTTYRAIVGKSYLHIGTDSFLWNFLIGIGVGFVWDLLLGKGGIWEAQARRTEQLKNTMAGLWEKDRGKALMYGLGSLLSAIPGVSRIGWIRRFMGQYVPIEADILKLEKAAEATLKKLIVEEEKTGAARTIAVVNEINRLRTEFNDQIQRIEAMNVRITRLRGGP